jgi:hypothetical protein
MLTSVLEAVALVAALVALWLSAEVAARLCQGLEQLISMRLADRRSRRSNP